MYTQKYFFALSGMGVLLLSGCAGYRSVPLDRLTTSHKSTRTRDAEEGDSKIIFSYKVYSKDDSKKYLGRDVLCAGYQPIQLTIKNATDHSFLFSPKNLSLPCVSYSEVSQKVFTSTAGRAAGYGAAGLFIPLFLIPAIVDGSKSYEANTKLEKDYAEKALDTQEIKPGMTINGIVFVPKSSYRGPFSLSLFDTESGKKVILSSMQSTSVEC